ncbi:MAG: hypothetical protein KJ950_06675 [Proteobacteria bacterium]|nr:hypothetical protein [Pseudomonadota bacterium]MBU1687218.1 hypothetical protein [Pseudomonadota bacterium]
MVFFSKLSSKITLAASLLTMTLVLMLGGSSYLFAYRNIHDQIRERINFESTIITNRFELLLDTISHDIKNIAQNLIMVNALIDSEGREVYVKPFLESYRLPENLPCHLSLCDFQGKPLITCGCPGEKAEAYDEPALLETVINQGKPLAMMRLEEGQQTLIIIHPVLYTATGRAEGMIVLETPFDAFAAVMLDPALRTSRDQNIRFTTSNQEIWSLNSTGSDHSHPLISQFNLHSPLDSLQMTMFYDVSDRKDLQALSHGYYGSTF